MSGTVIEARSLIKIYLQRKNPFSRPVKVKALDGVDLKVFRGETLGLVGESGSGKTTLGKIICGVESFNAGCLTILGLKVDGGYPRNLRGRVQMVFQDPFSSLNPRKRVGDIVCEPLVVKGVNRKRALRKAAELLERMGFSSRDLEKFPHEFSGGERQRISIARAVISEPEIVVLDEPTSSLDVFTQAQIVNLLLELKKERGLTYIFISHNLPLVARISDRIAVMKNGKIVELRETEALCRCPATDYTKALLEAVPRFYKEQRLCISQATGSSEP